MPSGAWRTATNYWSGLSAWLRRVADELTMRFSLPFFRRRRREAAATVVKDKTDLNEIARVIRSEDFDKLVAKQPSLQQLADEYPL